MYEKTKALIEAKRQASVFPGVVVCFLEGTTQETCVLGQKALEPSVETMTRDDLFDVASLTKVVCTTTVVLKLWEQGELVIDAPLQRYLPAFENPQITLRHLLTHTSDIQTWIENRDQLNAAQLRAAYLTLAPGEQLGEDVKYTDAGTILLGFMLEEIYGKSAVEIFTAEVLTPLNMTASTFFPKALPQVVPTEKQKDGSVLRGVTHDPKARVLAEHAGNAGLFTNLDDLTTFVKMYLNFGRSGEQSFLKETTIAALFGDQTPTKTGQRSLGWDLKYSLDHRPLLFHTGYTGTFLVIDVTKQSALIFLSNRVHPHDYRESYLRHRDEILATYLQEKG
ncbi:MAG: serine hydrolase domain-containing protein [Enterococcus sp.]